ncbi:MAG: PilZ domain-containing protein [Xanthomonadales bacterium]|nr:PilZ domain-containing protein [Xanthomonadales bacterium]
MIRSKRPGERDRRMRLRAEVVVLRHGEMWDSEVVDISASGMLIREPENWDGSLGDEMCIELILCEKDTIALLGKVVRYDGECLGLEFTHIPPRSEIPLWSLLGEYADSMEGGEKSA